MKLQWNHGLLTAVAFAVSAGLWAQGPGGPPRHGNMDFIAHEMMSSKPVKGVPFAADAVTTTTQALPNGTHINRTASASLYRDSEGRTRREEHSLTGVLASSLSASTHGRQTVFIHDPVAQASYVLNPAKKTAQKMAFAPHQGRGTSAGAGQEGTASAAEAEASWRVVKTDSLGTQVIDGIQVEGTRHTMTIPAGAIGNDQAIESVTERWYSPDLQVVVKIVRTDPRFGQTVYQLSNIRRGEQPASLFEVPSDFTVTAGGRGPRAAQ